MPYWEDTKKKAKIESYTYHNNDFWSGLQFQYLSQFSFWRVRMWFVESNFSAVENTSGTIIEALNYIRYQPSELIIIKPWKKHNKK